jgi:hypothetical protein
VWGPSSTSAAWIYTFELGSVLAVWSFLLLVLLYASFTLSMSAQRNADAVVDSLCERALEVVAKRGWLPKGAWSLSKAVHAFVKPIKVVLAAETSADIVQ